MLPVIATTIISLFLLMGVLVQFKERGYAFDLRKRKGKGKPQLHGRRATDHR